MQKLGLNRNFPETVLYTRHSALGLGLMNPKMILDMLKLKLYIKNK